ncbi:MAG: hypothetical protein Q8J89_05760 [Caulobacter sp.]|nr:hypothetical protein [Caulobacter sp.]
MLRIVWFLPALSALLAAAALLAFGPPRLSPTIPAMALVGASVALGFWAQKRAPAPQRSLGQPAVAAVIGVIVLATMALIVVLQMLDR